MTVTAMIVDHHGYAVDDNDQSDDGDHVSDHSDLGDGYNDDGDLDIR